jgi:phosphatidylglycerol:prolipoprotein diacylglycerol transferase
MLPYLFEVGTPTGPFRVPAYGSLLVLAFTLAFLWVHARAPKIGLHPDRLMGVYLAAAGGGILGSRLLYMIAVDPASLLKPSEWLSSGGFAFYGGLLGGAAGVFALAAVQGLQGWKLADLLAPGLVLGLGIGRLACFFAGCCHGAEAPIGADPVGLLPEGLLHGQIFWSDRFPFLTTQFDDGVGRLLHVPLYPTQAWSVVAGLSIWALLAWRHHHRRFDGQVVGTMLIVEPIARFLIESFRADHRGYAFTFPLSPELAARFPGLAQAGTTLGEPMMGVTTSQALGLGMIVVGGLILGLRRRAGVAPEQELVDEA